MTDYATRTEIIDGIPYEVRIHRNIEKRKANRARLGPNVQQEMNAVAIQGLAALDEARTEHRTVLFTGERGIDGISQYEILGAHVPLTDCAPEELDNSPITADSTPKYGTCAWGMKRWQDWYNALAAANGADAAAATWGAAFDITKTEQWAWYKNIQEFRDFCTQNNLIAHSLMLQGQAKAIQIKQDAAKGAEKILDNLGSIPVSATDVVSSTAKLMKALPWIAGGVLLLIAAVWTYISISNKKIAR